MRPAASNLACATAPGISRFLAPWRRPRRPGRHDGNSTLDKIRLAPRTDRVAEIPRNFLGNPHHLFPLGTDPAIGLASNSWLVTEVTMRR